MDAAGERVLAEIKLLFLGGFASMCGFHVFRGALDGDVEVQVEAEDCASDEHDEDAKRCVFEIGQLHLHRPELDSPADVTSVWWWGLEPHVLPVRRLEILEVVCLAKIEVLEVLGENHQRVSDEKVCEVRR